jgi:hypothetical protein
LKIRGSRSEVEMEVEAEAEAEVEAERLLQKYQIFAKRSRESSWVIDSIFELKSIHAGEVTYKQ